LLVPVPLLPQPGETVLGGDYALLPGGKGANQALAARRAGAAVTMAGAAGTYSFAGLALQSLRQGGVDLRLVRHVDRPTGCAAIMVGAAARKSDCGGVGRQSRRRRVECSRFGPRPRDDPGVPDGSNRRRRTGR